MTPQERESALRRAQRDLVKEVDTNPPYMYGGRPFVQLFGEYYSIDDIRYVLARMEIFEEQTANANANPTQHA
ncbi:hypothetical protein [Ralstonia phage phiRSL1]|uniref:Uncharacterized protein n=1 Tax=Ralstonia phage phiRSL1 TaxID=1980924 RepID=B2ZY78_9CAUD|nr:hypothetical protein RSL1_ORF266 [Ralstonia phage phiRSL1]BAG41713.1 hypothetical protein [Ralstonia phage phiRSL1]